MLVRSPPLNPGSAHLHLFALKLTGNAENRYDDVGILSCGNRLWAGRQINLHPHQLGNRITRLGEGVVLDMQL